jgi:hypothetical protein
MATLDMIEAVLVRMLRVGRCAVVVLPAGEAAQGDSNGIQFLKHRKLQVKLEQTLFSAWSGLHHPQDRGVRRCHPACGIRESELRGMPLLINKHDALASVMRSL